MTRVQKHILRSQLELYHMYVKLTTLSSLPYKPTSFFSPQVNHLAMSW